MINYCIFYDVAKSITELQNNTSYGLQINVKGNGVFWGTPTDAIANNLFKNNENAKSPMPGLLAGVDQAPNNTPVKKKPSSLWEGAKGLLSKVWDNRSTILGAVESIAPMLLATRAPQEDFLFAVKCNYTHSLQKLYQSLLSVGKQNPNLELQPMKDFIAKELLNLRRSKGRLYPIEMPNQEETIGDHST